METSLKCEKQTQSRNNKTSNQSEQETEQKYKYPNYQTDCVLVIKFTECGDIDMLLVIIWSGQRGEYKRVLTASIEWH